MKIRSYSRKKSRGWNENKIKSICKTIFYHLKVKNLPENFKIRNFEIFHFSFDIQISEEVKMKIVNHRRIKSKFCYQFNELSEVLEVTSQTIQNWHKSGMEVLDDTSRPFLVMGFMVKKFLLERKKKRKIELNKGEFLCPRCMCSRKSKPDRITVEKTGRKLGNIEQIFIKGVCAVCGCNMIFFTSERKIAEHTSILIGSESTSGI